MTLCQMREAAELWKKRVLVRLQTACSRTCCLTYSNTQWNGLCQSQTTLASVSVVYVSWHGTCLGLPRLAMSPGGKSLPTMCSKAELMYAMAMLVHGCQQRSYALVELSHTYHHSSCVRATWSFPYIYKQRQKNCQLQKYIVGTSILIHTE